MEILLLAFDEELSLSRVRHPSLNEVEDNESGTEILQMCPNADTRLFESRLMLDL